MRPRPSDQSPKATLIRHLLAAGTPPTVVKVAEGLDERSAFALERAKIAEIGRHPRGPLLNLSDGGEGVSAAAVAKELEWLAKIRDEDRHAWRAERARRADEKALAAADLAAQPAKAMWTKRVYRCRKIPGPTEHATSETEGDLTAAFALA